MQALVQRLAQGMSFVGHTWHLHAGILAWGTEVSLAGQAHLLDEVLSISADVIHTVLVDSEVCLESLVFLQ